MGITFIRDPVKAPRVRSVTQQRVMMDLVSTDQGFRFREELPGKQLMFT